jgi:CzcA family heavy metal efflux pump
VSLARFGERQSRAILFIVVLMAAAGVLAYRTLPSDIYPPLQFPRIVVIAHAGTIPSRSMLLSVTRPIEEAVMEVPGIRRVRSKTFRGATEISAQFEARTDIVLALNQVQNRVAELRGELPPETELTVERLTPAAFPVLSMNLTGGLPEADLRDYAFYVMRPRMARVPGVGRVEVMASDTREVEVVADPARLLAAGLTVSDLAAVLKNSNALQPVGRYAAGDLQHLVLASGLWKSVDDIRATPVTVAGGATVRVQDVADVFPGSPDRTSLVTGNGKPAALVNISEQVGASILEVRAGVEQAVEELLKNLPSGLSVSKVYDLAGFVADAIASVRDAILVGGVLAVAVLFFFLRSWRVTLIAALTLPLTVLATFAFMKLFGETINLMSMGGLAVAIGLVIDDAVVVVENIHRHLARGGGVTAIGEATAELVAPVVGSTLTTVVVFAPLGLLSGVVGQFFKALSITLTIAVLVSLALALTLIPLLAHWATRRDSGGAGHGSADKLERRYESALSATMKRPVLALCGIGVLVVLELLLFAWVPSGFLPKMDEGGFVVDYRSPSGSALESTDAVVRKLEALLAQTPEVASFSRRTGSELGLFATQQNKGDLLVRLKRRGERHRSADDIIDDLRPKMQAAAPTFEIEFVQLLQDMIGDLEGAPTPIEVKLYGDDPDRLAELAEDVEARVQKVRGVVDVVGVESGQPEDTWEIDPAAAARVGLTVAQVSDQLHAAWLGEAASELRTGDRTIPVRVRYPDAVRFDPRRLQATTVRGADGKLTTVGSVAHLVATKGAPVLTRESLRQMAMITARLENRDLGSAVREIRSTLGSVKLPIGYSFEVGGQYESQQQSFRELLMVFGIAASLVLFVLLVEFRAATPALLILAAAPLSFGGGLLMLVLTHTELNVSSAMGFILLVGLVVKNGIVMIDYAHRLHAEGQPFAEAIHRAAARRLRPILMTTLCTLFGLVPLALGWGSGAELQKPLALVVIGGLGLSTLVTLFAVPTLYVWIHGKSTIAG